MTIIKANPEMFVGQENVILIIDLYNQFVEERPTKDEMIDAIKDLDPEIIGDFCNRVSWANTTSADDYYDRFFGYDGYEDAAQGIIGFKSSPRHQNPLKFFRINILHSSSCLVCHIWYIKRTHAHAENTQTGLVSAATRHDVVLPFQAPESDSIGR